MTSIAPTVPRRRELVVAALANGIEWYDLAIYGALAPVLVVVLLPDGHGDSGLVTVFAVFATSFLARPFGALVVGRRADRLGRRGTLAAMVVMMSVATAAIGLLPPWETVGVLAPICLLTLRLAQGFSSGGEMTTSAAFIVESAPAHRWGRFGGWHTSTMALGIATGTAVAAALSTLLTDAELVRWGWRVPFLVALPLGLVGFYLRARLRESPAFETVDAMPHGSTLRRAWREHGRAVRTGFVLVGVLAGAFNLWFVFLPAYLVDEDTHALPVVLGGAVLGLLAAAVAAPTLGLVSDRVGRRPVLLVGTAGLALLVVPLFMAVTNGSVAALVLADVVVGVLLGALVITAHVAERFPVALRASGIALTYGLASAFIGGTAPLVGSLFARFDLPLGIPVYLAGLGVAGIAATLRSPAALAGDEPVSALGVVTGVLPVIPIPGDAQPHGAATR